MFKKTKIAAVTAAVLGLSSMALVPNAQAVSVNEAGSTGQVLIFPYYNVNNGFTTSFNITNTTDQYKAVKMRFRESKTSNDVLDFNVYMSPQDIFTVFLTQASDGGVLLSTNDKTCTHPKFPGAPVPFRDVYDSVENADMREGYLEVIEMGEINETAVVDTNGAGASGDITIASGLLHDSSGTPANCDVVELAWQQGVFVQGGAASNAGAINIVNPNVPGYPNNAAMGGALTASA
ncbi:MAG: hypothetical protein KAG86_01985, partial [Gammaproteobacteria bacterium]|nr:hypothetical protein [Gammaproteobacteria bacterium]